MRFTETLSSDNTLEFSAPDNSLQFLLDAVLSQQETSTVSVSEALNQITGGAVTAKRNIPERDNSAMDGFVFLRADTDSNHKTFTVTGEIRPEDDMPEPLAPRTSKAIMTGAPVPPGDIIVVPVEQISQDGLQVTIEDLPSRNPIRKKGEGYREGVVILEKGTHIRPYEAGLLTESGNTHCPVLKPIKIAIQVTGNEISESNNTNGPVLYELMRSWPGVEVTQWPVLGDDKSMVHKRLDDLKANSDIIITTGGISAGKHDYLYNALIEKGAQYLIRKINQKPGKPVSFAAWGDTIVCNLPGNPVSAVFTAEWYVRSLVRKLTGLQQLFFQALCKSELKNPSPKHLFLPARGEFSDGRFSVSASGGMASHLLQLYKNNNVYVHIPPKTTLYEGDLVTTLPLSTGLFV